MEDVDLHVGEPVRWTSAKVEEMLLLFSLDLTFSQIASALKISRNAAIAKAWRMGLSRNGHRITPRSIEEPEKEPRIRDRRIPKQPITLPTGPFMAIKLRKVKPDRVVPALVKINGHGTQIEHLNGHNCHWPIGTPGQRSFHFCGKDKDNPESPYCTTHERMAYLNRGR